MEIIVHLHGDGNGSEFMDNLKTGDKITLNKPRTDLRYYDKSVEKYVIFGDESSLGLVRSFLPAFQKNNHKFQFIFELDNENKFVPELLGLKNCFVFTKNGLFRNEEWVGDLPVLTIPEWREANFVLTGNVKSAQTFRKVINNKINGKYIYTAIG